MTGDAPISNECFEELRNAKNIIAAGGLISAVTLRRWMQSHCVEVRAVVFDLLFEGKYSVESLPSDEIRSFLIAYLKESILEDKQNDYRYSRFDAMLALRAWISRIDLCEPDDRKSLQLIKELLAWLCGLNANISRRVVDSILEHVFVDSSKEAFFSDWQSSATLSLVFHEAVQLASEWRHFGNCDLTNTGSE